MQVQKKWDVDASSASPGSLCIHAFCGSYSAMPEVREVPTHLGCRPILDQQQERWAAGEWPWRTQLARSSVA